MRVILWLLVALGILGSVCGLVCLVGFAKELRRVGRQR